MKILMVLENDFPPDVRVEKEAISLLNDGHEVAIAGITMKHDVPSETDYRGIRIFKRRISTLLHKSMVAVLRFPFYFNFWQKYLSELRTMYKFDVLHIHDLPLAQVGVRIKQQHNCKLVVDLHENYPALIDISPYSKTFLGRLLISIKQWRRYEKRILNSADAVITVIDEMAERIKNLGISEKKISVIPNLPSVDEMSSLKSNPDKENITLFYSGGVNFHRGLQIVFHALANIVEGQKNVRMWVVGKGSYLTNIEQLAEQLGISEYVTFWGWKPFDDMVKLLAKSDIALIPHLRSEQSDHSSPNKLYEYMYYKKPVMASDCRSVKRLIDETQSGMTYVADDPQSFAECFKNFLDPEKRKEFGMNGYNAVQNSLNWNASARELCTLYNNKL